MKKTYFEPEMEVTVMLLSPVMQEGSLGGDDDELGGDDDFGGNKRNNDKDATWGNLW